MYSIISIISAWIRQFYLPNPFAIIISNSSYADLFNILVGGIILHILSYRMTSIYYRRGNAPAIGSISYLFWYIINTFIFIGLGYLTASWKIYVILLLIIYAVLITLINRLCSNNYTF